MFHYSELLWLSMGDGGIGRIKRNITGKAGENPNHRLLDIFVLILNEESRLYYDYIFDHQDEMNRSALGYQAMANIAKWSRGLVGLDKDDIDSAFQNVTELTYSQNYHLSDVILNILRADGNVLLPVDTAGRVLELILILEQQQYWTQQHLTHPIFSLTYVASSTIDYVKGFLEWMSDSKAQSFELTHDNAFLLKLSNL
uniref:Cleavage and polyadenylation specificity factor subunit 2 n=1 Tax=Davidia involucrata TaxID=16924 RepID=A0A5B7ATE0_DAVIN